jgi:hypothetical protein
MHLQVCGVEEKVRNTRVRSLASPPLTGVGGVGRGEATGVGARRVRE